MLPTSQSVPRRTPFTVHDQTQLQPLHVPNATDSTKAATSQHQHHAHDYKQQQQRQVQGQQGRDAHHSGAPTSPGHLERTSSNLSNNVGSSSSSTASSSLLDDAAASSSASSSSSSSHAAAAATIAAAAASAFSASSSSSSSATITTPAAPQQHPHGRRKRAASDAAAPATGAATAGTPDTGAGTSVSRAAASRTPARRNTATARPARRAATPAGRVKYRAVKLASPASPPTAAPSSSSSSSLMAPPAVAPKPARRRSSKAVRASAALRVQTTTSGAMSIGSGHASTASSTTAASAQSTRPTKRAKKPDSRCGHACNHCRTRKRKCSGGLPCKRCETDGVNCQYEDRDGFGFITSAELETLKAANSALRSEYTLLQHIAGMQSVPPLRSWPESPTASPRTGFGGRPAVGPVAQPVTKEEIQFLQTLQANARAFVGLDATVLDALLEEPAAQTASWDQTQSALVEACIAWGAILDGVDHRDPFYAAIARTPFIGST